MMENNNRAFAKYGLTYGIIGAVMYSIYLFVKYEYFSSNALLFQASSFITYTLFIAIMVICAIRLRGRYADIGIGARQIFQALFIIILITETVFAIFNYVYLNYINPEVLYEIRDFALAHLEQKGNISAEDLEEYKENYNFSIEERAVIKGHIRQYVFAIILSSIVAILISLSVQRPRTENQL